MKDRGILHPQLSRVVAEMGHGDLLGVADAGLPLPVGVERVDLAVAPGVPGVLDVVRAVVTELRVEAVVLAEEARTACPQVVEGILVLTGDVDVVWVSHEQVKQTCTYARAVVRTAEFTPYANVLLRSGVDFGSG